MTKYSNVFLIFMAIGFSIVSMCSLVMLGVAAFSSKDENISKLILSFLSGFYFSYIHLDMMVAKNELESLKEKS